MKRFIGVMLLFIFLLSSCSSGGKTVMSLGNAKVSESEYGFWMSTYKARYVSAYTDIRDDGAYWASAITDGSDTTNEMLVNDLIRQNIKTNLVAMSLFAEEGLILSDAAKEEIDSYIQSLIDERCDGSRKIFNSELGKFGINMDMLRRIFINEQKISELYAYYFGENGTKKITDTERNEYYKDNYVRFIQINVNTAFAYEEDGDGSYIQDTDGSYVKRKLTSDELSEKKKRTDEIDALLSKEECDWDELYEKYSENTFYPNGYYFSSETAANYVGEIVTEAFTIDVGEWKKIVSEEYGTFYIKRLELDEGAYRNEENSDFFDGFDDTVSQSLFDDIMTAEFEKIVIDEELLNAVSVADVEANYYFY